MGISISPIKSQEIAERLKQGIRSGNLASGTRLGSIRKLAKQFETTPRIVHSAFDRLEKEQLIYREAGRGTFVGKPAPSHNRAALIGLLTGYEDQGIEGYFEPLHRVSAETNMVSMVSSWGEGTSCEKGLDNLLSLEPAGILIDVEARRVPLADLREKLGKTPHCFVNRWEWEAPEPECGVLVDYTAMITEALIRFQRRGHQRIAFVGHHVVPQPYLSQRLKFAAEQAGLNSPSAQCRYVSLADFDDVPERLEMVFGNPEQCPTAILGMADSSLFRFISRLQEQFLSLPDFDLVGCFDDHWSRLPGHEFSSYRIDFAQIWQEALQMTTGPAAGRGLRRIPPKLVER
jgi:DNA-binding LacI/PurR family transcriptional regulator